MFVLSSDFDVLPFSIPDLPPNTFPDYVEEQEEAILKRLLGKTFYDEFIAGRTWQTWTSAITFGDGDLATDGVNLWESLQAANTNKALAEGAWWTQVTDNIWFKLEYGADYEYSGKDYDWKGMKHLLKPYIYYMWVRDSADNQTSIGVVVPNAENAQVISPYQRIVRGWNEFVVRAGADYSIANTLYGYLIANVADFPEGTEEFCQIGFMNQFDL